MRCQESGGHLGSHSRKLNLLDVQSDPPTIMQIVRFAIEDATYFSEEVPDYDFTAATPGISFTFLSYP